MSQNDGVRAGFRAAHEAPDGSSPKASIPDAEIAAIADVLHEAAIEYYGQGFKTERAYWLTLAEAVRIHLEQSE